MGTPEFAIPPLDILLKNDYPVAGVITAPDKPRGRGRQLAWSPVKTYALERNLLVLQPANLRDKDFQEQLSLLRPDLQVVVAFRMLPEAVWSLPVSGTINLHASLLPEYRGAAPVNWALINGESRTGLTTFFIDKDIDTGNIILQEEQPIYPDDDAGSLHDRMMIHGAELVLKTVNLIREGKAVSKKQSFSENLKPAPKITREMCRIDFSKPADQVRNFIRGLSPFPGAWTLVGPTQIKIYRVSCEEGNLPVPPGQFVTDQKSFLKFMTGSGIINVLEFQVEGKKRMSAVQYFMGNKL